MIIHGTWFLIAVTASFSDAPIVRFEIIER
jgi:hypothetical protein